MRTIFRLAYISGIGPTPSGWEVLPSPIIRHVEHIDVRSPEGVVASIQRNFGFSGELDEWVTPSALLSVQSMGTVDY